MVLGVGVVDAVGGVLQVVDHLDEGVVPLPLGRDVGRLGLAAPRHDVVVDVGVEGVEDALDLLGLGHHVLGRQLQRLVIDGNHLEGLSFSVWSSSRSWRTGGLLVEVLVHREHVRGLGGVLLRRGLLGLGQGVLELLEEGGDLLLAALPLDHQLAEGRCRPRPSSRGACCRAGSPAPWTSS